MKKYFFEFCKRGITFGALGPLVLGIVYTIIDFCGVRLDLSGWQFLVAIISTYVLAFIQAGSSVFEQIEEWSIIKSLFIHMLSIYLIYLITYLINSWIPFHWVVIIIFSAAVIITFLIIWLIVYALTNIQKNKLNSKINSKN